MILCYPKPQNTHAQVYRKQGYNKQTSNNNNSQIPLTSDVGQYDSGDILAQQGEDHSWYGYHHAEQRETNVSREWWYCIMFRAVAALSLVFRPLPLLRRDLRTRPLLHYVSGTPKSFFVSSGTIFAESQNRHKFVEIVVGKLFFNWYCHLQCK